MVRLMLTILPKAHPVSFFQSLIPKLSRLLSFVYMIRIVELIVDRNCKSFTTFSYLNNAQFRKVYGLLLVREGLHIRYRTRMYIRLFIGDAISQPSMHAHPGAS